MLVLGFQNLFYIFSFILGLIVSFVIRWKWNKAVERKREIIRLVAMAKEEAARIELQAAEEYYFSTSTSTSTSTWSGGGRVSEKSELFKSQFEFQPQCAVCYSPTTTRCSRCKAVRYCSGKCQIIHWRQGHKDECYPPNNTFQFNGPESDTDKKAVSQGTQDEVDANDAVIKESFKDKPIETYAEEPADCKVAKASVNSDSITSSSVGCCDSTANEPLANASVSEVPVLSTPDGPEEPLSNNISQEKFDAKADVNGSKLTKSPPLESSMSDVSVDSIFHCESTSYLGSTIDVLGVSEDSKLSTPNSDFWDEALDSNGYGNNIDNDSSQSSVSEGGEDNVADKIVTDVPMAKSSPTMRFEKPISADNMSSDSQILGHRGANSSSSASGDNTDSVSGQQPVSNIKSSSVRKVIQQFKVYKLSKHYANGDGHESAEKYNYKMVFPYELFVKLYHWDNIELRPCGLRNIGNSCYANAVLQCLTFTRPLTAYLLQGFHSKACPKKEWCFMCEFEGLVLKAKEGKSPLSPTGILSQLKSIGSHLGHGQEEDAHEFLRYVIDKMQSVCLKEAGEIAVGPLSEETTLIGLIFGGYLQSKIRCMKCHGKSEKRERMMDLTVEIHGDIGTLEGALTQFTATEFLDGDNKYKCLRCGSFEKAKKKLTILEAPNVLTITLKRFQSGDFGKLNKSVQFPEFLNLAPYMSGTGDRSPLYRLYAVVVHLDTRKATFSGHYVCYVRTIHGKWFNVDDSLVEPVELEKVLSEEAYMLLYARRSPWAPSLIRNTITNGKIKERSRRSENFPVIRSGTFTSRASPSSTSAQRRIEDVPNWTTLDSPTNFECLDPFDRRFYPMHRIPRVESSSDNSSLLSCSDEGSSTTESTRDSASTDDFPEYMYVEAGRNWNSPLRVLEDSDIFSPLADSYRHVPGFPETSGSPSHGVWSSQSQDSGIRGEGLPEKGSLPILHNDTSKHFRKLTNNTDSNNNRNRNSDNCSSSSNSAEINLERLGSRNTLDVNSGVSQRRPIPERIDQTFY